MNSFEFLPWDSAFFGYRVARVVINNDDPYNYEQTLRILDQEQARLTYILVSPEALRLNSMIKESGGLLVDKKVTFCKTCASHSGFRNEIMEYSGTGDEKELSELALQAGLYSRFRIDCNFRNEIGRAHV